MARTYKRDSRGRFAGGGGGGGGGKGGSGKGGSTRGANNATTKRLQDKGLTGIGSRLKGKNASLYSGTERTKKGRAQLWANAEQNQKTGSMGQGAQFSRSRPGGVVRRRKG
jgi:hypothetical protein